MVKFCHEETVILASNLHTSRNFFSCYKIMSKLLSRKFLSDLSTLGMPHCTVSKTAWEALMATNSTNNSRKVTKK